MRYYLRSVEFAEAGFADIEFVVVRLIEGFERSWFGYRCFVGISDDCLKEGVDFSSVICKI